MFEKECLLQGKHENAVHRLTHELGDGIDRGIFKTNYEVYVLAPLVGVLYNRRAQIDKGEGTTKIFGDQVKEEIGRT